jgi:AcrR family transcriptional regulator
VVVVQRGPRVGRRPGNQDTRGQILTAARGAFASRGFAAASLRAIAADAGVDAALIHHYFDSKQQLFLATVALPANLPELMNQVAAGGTDGAGERVVAAILGLWDSELQPALVGALRTALAEPTLTRSIGEFLSLEILGRLPHPPDLAPDEASRRTGLVASQLLGLIIGRYVLRLPALTSRTSAELVSEVGPTIQRYLDPPSS